MKDCACAKIKAIERAKGRHRAFDEQLPFKKLVHARKTDTELNRVVKIAPKKNCSKTELYSYKLCIALLFTIPVKPRLIAQPHAVYQRFHEGEPEVNINVTVKGGEPKAQVSWFANIKLPLLNMRKIRGRGNFMRESY